MSPSLIRRVFSVRLNQVPNDTKLVIDASKTVNIDHDVVEIIEEFEEMPKFRGIELEIIERNVKGVPESGQRIRDCDRQNTSIRKKWTRHACINVSFLETIESFLIKFLL